MEHKIINKFFNSHNEARDSIAENPSLILEGAITISKEYKVFKGAVDILLKKDNIIYFVEIKDKESIYTARKQLERYSRAFKLFSEESGQEMKFIIFKLQKYIGCDVYYYENESDLINRNNNYQKINIERQTMTRNLPDVKEKYKKAISDPKTKAKWKKSWSVGRKNNNGTKPINWKPANTLDEKVIKRIIEITSEMKKVNCSEISRILEKEGIKISGVSVKKYSNGEIL